MIQLIVTIHDGQEPDGRPTLTTQQALLNIEPKTQLEIDSAEQLSVLFTAAMHQWNVNLAGRHLLKVIEWYPHWKGTVAEFTSIELTGNS